MGHQQALQDGVGEKKYNETKEPSLCSTNYLYKKDYVRRIYLMKVREIVSLAAAVAVLFGISVSAYAARYRYGSN